MTENDIIDICKKYNIENHVINSDMSVDVDGNVYLQNKHLTIIPLKFGKVTGTFYCSDNSLTTLKDCPHYVGGNFSCSYNELTSLEHCPKHIGVNFFCSSNKISSLNHLPINFYIGGSFSCPNNNITPPTEFSRLFFGTINGEIFTGYDKLDIFLNKHKNPPKKDLPKILSELRKIQL